MLIADWIAIGLIILFAILGLLVGFGKGLRFFTRGFFGFLISIFICYSLGGFIIKIGFVQTLLGKFVAALTDKNTFCDILIKIRIDIIVYYIVLFIIVQILRAIIVKIISRVFEIENVFLKVINKVFGMVLFVGALVLITMFAFQIIYVIGGTTAERFVASISGSRMKLDWFYANNPFIEIVKILFRLEIRIPVEVG